MSDTTTLTVKEWVEHEQGKHLCQCGCGKPINVRPWHHSAGIPRIHRGHIAAEKRYGYRPEKHEQRPCACGCGELVSGVKDGKLVRYRKGHWARDHQPMKRPEVAAKHRGMNHARAVPFGTRRVKDSRDGLSYVRIKCPDGKWRYEHRWIMEQHLGRKLKRSEHVHHRNHDGLDNRLENLEVLPQSVHSKLHCTFSNAPVRRLVNGELVEVPRE